jgi:hypothetical protein
MTGRGERSWLLVLQMIHLGFAVELNMTVRSYADSRNGQHD